MVASFQVCYITLLPIETRYFQGGWLVKCPCEYDEIILREFKQAAPPFD